MQHSLKKCAKVKDIQKRQIDKHNKQIKKKVDYKIKIHRLAKRKIYSLERKSTRGVYAEKYSQSIAYDYSKCVLRRRGLLN